MSEPLLRIVDVEKRYTSGDVEVRALRGVSLDIHPGEFVAIMGPSGSGKSTLMNVVGCLDRPTSGKVLLEGRDLAKLDHDQLAEIRNLTLGFVFQSFHLLARTSALENVELPLVYAGVKGPERRARAAESLRLVGLEERKGHHPNQLSGGQQQRVAIARAIVNQPKLLVADEPTGNLDSKTSLEIMALFQELGRRGLTIVLVTHEPDIASYASRVLIVRDGLVQSDKRQRPRSAADDMRGLPEIEEAAS